MCLTPTSRSQPIFGESTGQAGAEKGIGRNAAQSSLPSAASAHRWHFAWWAGPPVSVTDQTCLGRFVCGPLGSWQALNLDFLLLVSLAVSSGHRFISTDAVSCLLVKPSLPALFPGPQTPIDFVRMWPWATSCQGLCGPGKTVACWILLLK